MRVALFFVLILLAGWVPPLAAGEFSSLEERMSDGDFRAAGLDKLSPEELARLNSWLRTRSSNVPAAAPSIAEDRVGFRQGEADRGPVLQRIDGKFTGWSGKTVFKLNNGQWWQQTESGSFSVPPMDSPEVTIKPMVLGSWLLQVQGHNRTVRVTRIR